MKKNIPFNKPYLSGKEFDYTREAIEQMHISGDGSFTKRCHALLEEMLGVKKTLLTTSCTHALEMAAILLDIKPGDEVIVPSFTFVSTVNAFVLRGAKPVFADIRPDTLNMHEACLEKLITSRTKAIVPVHYAGVGCEMSDIKATASRHGIAVVEDNAHGILARYKGQKLGTFGCMATLSFHETKNFQCGEGGALLINDPSLIERAEIIREKGTNRSRFFRGQIDKYTWVDIGSSFLPSDLLAAFLCAQLESAEKICSMRKRIWQNYYAGLKEWAASAGVAIPSVPSHCDQSHHLFYLIMPDAVQKQAMIEHLKACGISSVFHYLPLHLSEYWIRFGGKEGDCPVTEDLSARLLRLPFYNELSEPDQAYIIEMVQSFEPLRRYSLA